MIGPRMVVLTLRILEMLALDASRLLAAVRSVLCHIQSLASLTRGLSLLLSKAECFEAVGHGSFDCHCSLAAVLDCLSAIGFACVEAVVALPWCVLIMGRMIRCSSFARAWTCRTLDSFCHPFTWWTNAPKWLRILSRNIRTIPSDCLEATE